MLTAATVLGLVVGVWHLWLAGQAIFVFSSGEPWSSWVAMLLGPVSTLPAVATSLFRRRAAGYWLITAGLISFGAFLVGEDGVTENLLSFLWMLTGPMLVIGIVMILLAPRLHQPAQTPAATGLP